MKLIKNNGGRPKDKLKGTGDCVCRSVSIVTGIPYKKIRNKLINLGIKNPDNGVYFKQQSKLMYSLGYYWISCMRKNRKDNKYLIESDLPFGKLIVLMKGHSTAVIDKIIHDNFNPNNIFTRQIKGYFKKRRIE